MTLPLSAEHTSTRSALLAARRSREYPQTSGQLRRGPSFCLLGVAADLAVKRGRATWDGDVLCLGEQRFDFGLPEYSDVILTP
ncbi:hypothetical protein GO986_17450 [Deinococcus sp. HMF7620]|uniref:Uncharacterized protein n=1 Tax=Deinococcus arboris TaxID=2682977 RepID=A0A7C9HTT8_9DEIO|nr:hypothetical protein [Deinococcus arboris]MVN88527.1 hypothetical protein [Deinococcus arboris]